MERVLAMRKCEKNVGGGGGGGGGGWGEGNWRVAISKWKIRIQVWAFRLEKNSGALRQG